MLPIDLEIVRRVARWDELPASDLGADIHASAQDSGFPGAILPIRGDDGQTFWLAVARTAAEWRALQPLLSAHAGPTLTDFNGIGRALHDNSPVELELRRVGATICVLLRPGSGCEAFTVKALARLVRTMRDRPPIVFRGREPTSKLLGRLELCLSVGDRDGATDIFAVLRDEFRVDSLNQHFLEVRVLAQFRDWADLVSRPWFEMLCFTRKPASVAEDMLRALWYTHLEPKRDDDQLVRRTYDQNVRPLALALFTQIEQKDGDGVRQIYDLERIETSHAAQETLADFEQGKTGGHEKALDPEVAAVAMPFSQPHNWLAWLESIYDREFDVYSRVATEGVTQWRIPDQHTAAWASQLADSVLTAALSTGVARDRLIECLPQLVRCVRADSEYPRATCATVYSALLQVLGLADYKSPDERNVAFDLFDGLLHLGPDSKAYRRLLADFEGFIQGGAGTATAYWLIDVAATLVEAPGPDEDARLRLLNRVLSSLQSVRAALRPAHRAAYNIVATIAGWETLPSNGAAAPNAPTIPNGSTIAIYTLTESAARQAEKALLDVQPSLMISLVHDKVASPRLTRLARDADLFVFASASATHAASDCIMANRAGKPLAYAVGRGFSSLVRAVEDHFERSSNLSAA